MTEGGGMMSPGSPLSRRRVGPCPAPFTISGASDTSRSCASVDALCSPTTIESFLSESPFTLSQARSWGDLIGNPKRGCKSRERFCSRYFLMGKSQTSGTSESEGNSDDASRQDSVGEKYERRGSGGSVLSTCPAEPQQKSFLSFGKPQYHFAEQSDGVETVELGLLSDQPNVHLNRDKNVSNYGTISNLILAPRDAPNGVQADEPKEKPFLNSTMRQRSIPFIVTQNLSSPKPFLKAGARQSSRCSLNVPNGSKGFLSSRTRLDAKGFLESLGGRRASQGLSHLRVPGGTHGSESRKGSFLSAMNSSILDRMSLASFKSSCKSLSRSEEMKNKIIQNFNTVG